MNNEEVFSEDNKKGSEMTKEELLNEIQELYEAPLFKSKDNLLICIKRYLKLLRFEIKICSEINENDELNSLKDEFKTFYNSFRIILTKLCKKHQFIPF